MQEFFSHPVLDRNASVLYIDGVGRFDFTQDLLEGFVYMSASDLKQQILHEYNRIHRELFGLGLREQSIEFSTNKIIIFDVSTRAPVLTTITSTHPALVSRMDDLLLEIYKEKLTIHFRKTLQLNIVAILKDYDAATEYSGTIIVLDRDVCCYYE